MNIGIILSGGVGVRMGLSIPKQYAIVNEQPVIKYCLNEFLINPRIDAIVVVVADEWLSFVKKIVAEISSNSLVYYAQPGETRQYSIYNALKVVQEKGFCKDDIVVIHDAARPLVSNFLINQCIDECREVDGVMPVIPVKDTIYQSTDGMQIQSLLNRNQLWAGQAPEAFKFAKYLHIHEMISRDELLKINGSTEIAYKYGLNCKMIKGDPMNFKITTQEDIYRLEVILKS